MTTNQVTQSAFPRTRYQGSKRKLLGWIWENLGDLPFDTVLDAFGGTGAVSHLFKQQGKLVTYNDVLRFNHLVGTALIENSSRRLSDREVESLITPDRATEYDDLITRTFAGVYFTEEENRWLDVTAQNINRWQDPCGRAVAYYALFQSCLAKRPYNLFHRKNLYMRTAKVGRSFGNKATWDRDFAEHFRAHVRQANEAVFDNGRACRALNLDATEVPGQFDLVYIDPPYVSARSVGVDYHAFYHFLEGLTDYGRWSERIDYDSKHRRLKPVVNPWTSADTNVEAFCQVFQRFADSILVVSYRSDGCPSVEQLHELLGEVRPIVRVVTVERYQYALSKNRRSREALLIAG